MTEKIIVAGSGGQGIMLLGKIIALAAMRQGLHTAWLPAYGPEVRGGSAYCMVIVSDEEIGSPYITRADTLIAMNDVSLQRFRSRVNPRGGLCIANSSLVAAEAMPKGACAGAFTDIAMRLGNIRVANMVALGMYMSKKGLISVKSVYQAMEESAPAGKKDLVAVNQAALKEGMRVHT